MTQMLLVYSYALYAPITQNSGLDLSLNLLKQREGWNLMRQLV